MTEIQKYPLTWPVGQPRSTNRKHAMFGKRDSGGNGQMKSLSIASAMNRLRDELERLKINVVDDSVVSSNLKLNLSGMPRSDQGEPIDPGVAVYWTSKQGPRVMAIDIYSRVADNIAAVARTLEYMRGIERHGGSHIQEQAFRGFDALPPPDDCWKILGIDRSTVMGKDLQHRGQYVMDAFRIKARDAAKTGEDMDRIVKARDKALEAAGSRG